MKKTLFLGILALASAFVFTACEDDDASMYFPTWKGFKIDRTTLVAGKDTLKIHADLNKPGKYLYRVSYKWTMVIDTISDDGKQALDTLVYTIQSSASHPIHMNDEPSARFIIPANAVKGTMVRPFTFTCDYEHAAAGVPVAQDMTQPFEGYLGGHFKYQILSPLYSRTSNSFTTPITIE